MTSAKVKPAGTFSSASGTFVEAGSSIKHIFTQIKYEHLLAGVSGGVTSSLLLHPLDLIKIRFAVNDGHTAGVPKYQNLRSALRTILRQEGARGLYRGVTPNVWGSGSAWGFYFLFYNSIKSWVQAGNARQPLRPIWHMGAAGVAGVMTLVMTNPLWVVKTRLCLQHADPSVRGPALPPSKCYAGTMDALAKIYRTEGLRGLYKGFVPGMFGVSHGALQFMTYEEMKNQYNIYRDLPIDTKLATTEYLLFAAASKLSAAFATYPYQVVRARLQDQHSAYAGSADCVMRTFRTEGIRGFYKGLTPYLLHVTPNVCLVFLIYEKFTSNS